MIGGMIYRGDFPFFMQPGNLKAAMNQYWEKYKIAEMKSRYYREMDTDNPFEFSYGMVGMGNARRKREGEAPLFDSPRMGRPMTYVFPGYALATSISREAQSDDKQNILVPTIIRELKRALWETKEQDAISLYTNGFTYQGWEPDGVALFATNHPVLRPQPGAPAYWSNCHPTAAALTITSLDAAYTSLRTTLNDSGRWLSELTPKYLDVHPVMEPYARQIVGTARVLGSNFNDKNLYFEQLEVRSNPRFTSNNAWFLSCEAHEWKWYTRESDSIVYHIDPLARATTMMVYERWGRGADSGRGKYGSNAP